MKHTCQVATPRWLEVELWEQAQEPAVVEQEQVVLAVGCQELAQVEQQPQYRPSLIISSELLVAGFG